MDIMEVVFGLSCAVTGVIFLAWNCKKELKGRGTGAVAAILLSTFIIFFCVAVSTLQYLSQ